jgi:thiamine-monophosphate kinase
MAWDELELHAWIRERFDQSGLLGGRGNDAAVLERLARPVVCVDQTIAGVHFEPAADPGRVGRKACARALSDLAASAAEPRAVLVALALRRSASAAWARRVLLGVAEMARRHGAILAGGDLSELDGPRGAAAIAVTALGEGRARSPIGRQRARPGELVLLTGPVGGSPLGRHLDFEPRVAAGLELARAGVRCMLDTTDGLALDLWRLAEASGVRIDLERVPLHADARAQARRTGSSALEHALEDGEDYELVATLSPRAFERLERSRALPGLAAVGRVRRGRGLYVPRAGKDGEPREDGALERWHRGGFVHGR